MVPVSTTVARQRSERRIAVHLPMRVRGKDSRGVAFDEDTSSENLCRSGAAFLTRFDVAIGSSLEIRIPFSNYASRRGGADFFTQGRVVHIRDAESLGEKFVGVQFTGPRFQRMFRSESAA
jgi:PilZ domain-containing protein